MKTKILCIILILAVFLSGCARTNKENAAADTVVSGTASSSTQAEVFGEAEEGKEVSIEISKEETEGSESPISTEAQTEQISMPIPEDAAILQKFQL
ncbi:MAG: hypothetical protein IJ043_03550 [Clostridia bacterium]|nr:hypothetical protein [Clostridia bacterium]